MFVSAPTTGGVSGTANTLVFAAGGGGTGMVVGGGMAAGPTSGFASAGDACAATDTSALLSGCAAGVLAVFGAAAGGVAAGCTSELGFFGNAAPSGIMAARVCEFLRYARATSARLPSGVMSNEGVWGSGLAPRAAVDVGSQGGTGYC